MSYSKCYCLTLIHKIYEYKKVCTKIKLLKIKERAAATISFYLEILKSTKPRIEPKSRTLDDFRWDDVLQPSLVLHVQYSMKML